MARVTGDKNRSLREQKLVVEKEVLKAKLAAAKAQVKAKNFRIKELSGRV
jgi:hypothetical protein